ncbi:unnamed protein product [Zymoseptoria tritici ST99CH_3D7]|uniref:Uncharacterized protein n=1 Tax=Zymoseptoria tritici (strain ST99CH_3D7) TaxID=1276538 RepID=A0A1X7RWZ4_ZYMT9|nr:unnamed protein product [Zymoseptoria tritici ST99CH_3D7]
MHSCDPSLKGFHITSFTGLGSTSRKFGSFVWWISLGYTLQLKLVTTTPLPIEIGTSPRPSTYERPREFSRAAKVG